MTVFCNFYSSSEKSDMESEMECHCNSSDADAKAPSPDTTALDVPKEQENQWIVPYESSVENFPEDK